MFRTPHRPRSAAFVAVVIGLASLMTTCADASDDGTQPRENEPLYGDGAFDDIALVPGSKELGPASEEGGVVAQSFFTRSHAPHQVLAFYQETLDGEWVLVQPPRKLGADQTWRGRWRRGAETLVVSATDDDTLEQDDDDAVTDVATQYSLSLGPDQLES